MPKLHRTDTFGVLYIIPISDLNHSCGGQFYEAQIHQEASYLRCRSTEFLSVFCPQDLPELPPYGWLLKTPWKCQGVDVHEVNLNQ